MGRQPLLVVAGFIMIGAAALMLMNSMFDYLLYFSATSADPEILYILMRLGQRSQYLMFFSIALMIPGAFIAISGLRKT